MNLGKTIYEHRIKNNLSQGDLAEMLNVSRQSVSKWENNSAVPDLDKIIKLSEIFHVSLDEHVKGEAASSNESVQVIKEVVIQSPQREPRKTAGIVLYFMGLLVFFLILFLAGSIGGILYSLPFFVCGTICFLFHQYVGLWCAWAVYLMSDAFMRMAMGITIGMVRHTLIWTQDMNYARLAIAWIFLAITLLLITITILIFMKKTLKVTASTNKHLTFGWICWFIVFLIHQLFVRSELYTDFLSAVISIPMAYYVLSMFSHWFRNGFLLIMILFTLRVHHSKKIKFLFLN